MKKVIFPFCEKNPRCGEGAAVVLNDGRIFIAYSLFTGGKDHDSAAITGAFLDPENGEMTEERTLFSNSGCLNQMSVSLERLNDGSIGIVFGRKFAADHGCTLFARSFDECRTWSEPVVISQINPAIYFVKNNDRLRQFKSGRLAIPVAVYPEAFNGTPSYMEVWYSDDMGMTWQRSRAIVPCPEPPQPVPCASGEFFENCCKDPYREQEPGIEECADGTIYFYCRTPLGCMYQAWSYDQGESFTELSPQKDIVSPLSPQSVRREPGTSRLWCVYNNTSIMYGDTENHWGWRTPLALSYSDDNGKSWKFYQQIEDDSHNYCYTSMTFIGKTLLLTYYESENLADGRRRNLASLKMQTLPLP